MKDTTIKDKLLSDLEQKMSDHIPQWAATVAKLISDDKEWKRYSSDPCTESNARNIASGRIKSQLHRKLFLKHATQILLEDKEEKAQLLTAVNQVL